MAWAFYVVRHSTRKRLVHFEPAASSLTRRLGGVSTCTLSVRDEGDGKDWGDDALGQLWGSIIVAEWDGRVWGAWYLVDDADDAGSRTVDFSGADVRAVLEHRYQFAVEGEPTYPNGKLTISGKSRGGAVRAMLARQVATGSALQWNLPIVLPADGAGGLSFTFNQWEFASVEKMLDAFEGAKGGADVDFFPRWNARDELEWEARVGSPRVAAGRLDLVLGTMGSDLVSFKRRRDSSGALSGLYTVGVGSDEDMLVGKAGGRDTGTGVVFRDGHHAYKELTTVPELNAQAEADLDVFGEATVQWSITYRPGEAAPVDPGCRVRVYVEDIWRLKDGWYDMYAVEVKVTLSGEVTLELQPWKAS